MAKRLPSQPPVLPGFTHVRSLGTGGFSDVFLYEQDLPRREVAVKVMLPEHGDTDLTAMFITEADALARLESHSAILRVYSASRAADGRPYLVMEYCPSSYATVFREYILSVPEVLDTSIRIAGALESVHRAGLFHRDVKPANILRTSAGQPVLSDFGVAAPRYFAGREDRVAMSVPWSAPEILTEEVTGSVAADVWSLGATVYSLLAGQSPFEQEGAGENAVNKLQRRILRAHYVPVGRDDVPEALEGILARALSLRPQSRQSSARALGEQLQAVQRDLGLAETPLEVIGEDGIGATVDAISRTTAEPGRLPDAVRVSYERRPRQTAEAANRREPIRSVAGVPNTEPKRGASKLVLAIGIAGGFALVTAVILLVIGR